MKKSEIINDGIEKLKECPKCNSYYTDRMPFSLVGEPFKNGIRASYTKFECSRCETEFISFSNYKQVREAELTQVSEGGKIKLLTYGSASLHSRRSKKPLFWKQCFQYSEKQDCIFFEIRGRVFCSFVEEEIPKIEEIGVCQKKKNKFFDVIRIDVEEMIFSVEPKAYENTEKGLEIARTDFRNRKLKSKFLSMSKILD